MQRNETRGKNRWLLRGWKIGNPGVSADGSVAESRVTPMPRHPWIPPGNPRLPLDRLPMQPKVLKYVHLTQGHVAKYAGNVAHNPAHKEAETKKAERQEA